MSRYGATGGRRRPPRRVTQADRIRAARAEQERAMYARQRELDREARERLEREREAPAS